MRLDRAGAAEQSASPSAFALGPDPTPLSVRYAVPDCAALDGAGALRLAVDDGRRARELVVPLGRALAAGCDGRVVPGVAVLGVRVLGGSAVLADDGLSATGEVVVEVRSAGAEVLLVAVRPEVAGVLFDAPTLGPQEPALPAGARREVVVPFLVPFCPTLRPFGQVVVAVRGPEGTVREVRATVAADGEARRARDVDLDVVLRACTPAP